MKLISVPHKFLHCSRTHTQGANSMFTFLLLVPQIQVIQSEHKTKVTCQIQVIQSEHNTTVTCQCRVNTAALAEANLGRFLVILKWCKGLIQWGKHYWRLPKSSMILMTFWIREKHKRCLIFFPTMLNFTASISTVCIYAIIFFNCKNVGNIHVEYQLFIVTLATVITVFTSIY